MTPAPAAYAPHEVFVAPARKRPQIWRVVSGTILAGFAYVALSQVYFTTLYGLLGPAEQQALFTGDTVLSMFFLLGSFGFMTLGAALAARLLHSRSFGSLLGPRAAFLPQFRRVVIVLAGLGIVIALLPPWDMGAPYVPNLPLGTWLLVLPASLLGVLVQVSAEEIFFRGYLQQQLAARFTSPLVWMILPSVLFAVGHYSPSEAGPNAWIVVVWAGLFGLLMADLTARSGSLGPAIAVHFVNNVSAILIVSLPDSLSGLALYLTPFGMDDWEALRPWLPVDFALMLVGWLAARLALRR
ncbi:MAG: CPBP family intramembrane metalloprotease [Sulfitobacter sp.]|nr:CPBP family intramembrane metalloprotease [Sulfitobacter sp.]